MDTLDSMDPRVAGLRSPGLAARRGRRVGTALMLTSSASNQAGAAVGATAFPGIGTVGVVAVRQLVTALILVPAIRPDLRAFRRDQWILSAGLAAVMSAMNLSLYTAVDRIGLGLAVTLEFLGPLAVAVVSSRAALDYLSAVLAGTGVVVLTAPGPATDVVGIGCALLAATCWGAYIVLNRAIGRRVSGLQGTAAASAVSAVGWLPVAIAWFTMHAPTVKDIALATGCGIMSSIVPYIADLLALRRVSAQMFGIFTSVNPVWAALAGWAMLGQALKAHEWLGIGIIVVSNVSLSLRTRGTHRRSRHTRDPMVGAEGFEPPTAGV